MFEHPLPSAVQEQMNTYKFWIKERYNPQLGTYYVPMGQMSERKAKKMGSNRSTLYGHNELHSFSNKEEYDSYIQKLRESGEKIH